MTAREVSADVDTSPDAMLAYRLAKTIHRSGGNPSSLFGLLDRLVREESWKRLRDVEGQPFSSFTELVESPEPFGLGTTRTELRLLIALRHPHEGWDPEWKERAPELRREVNRLLDEDIPAAQPAVHAGPGRGHKTGSGTTGLSGGGRGADYLTARLKRDDPETAERVVKGEISANAAAGHKGWKKPRVELRRPETVARKIRESFTEDQIAQLIALLLPSGNDP